jgi:hypothetical protein
MLFLGGFMYFKGIPTFLDLKPPRLKKKHRPPHVIFLVLQITFERRFFTFV